MVYIVSYVELQIASYQYTADWCPYIIKEEEGAKQTLPIHVLFHKQIPFFCICRCFEFQFPWAEKFDKYRLPLTWISA